jgi:hypothetical protein
LRHVYRHSIFEEEIEDHKRAISRRKAESRPTGNDQNKTEKTTEKREENAFIAGRTGALHHSLQSKGGKEGRQHSPQQAPVALKIFFL